MDCQWKNGRHSHRWHVPAIHCNWGNPNLYLDQPITKGWCQPIDPSHKAHNASDYPTMHHFVTEMCTHVHISVTKCCIMGYGTAKISSSMKAWAMSHFTPNIGIILGMRSVSERWRYNVTSSLIGWAHTQNVPCGVSDLWDHNKILRGGDLSHLHVPDCIWVFFYFVWFVFIHHNFQFYFELYTYCNILDIYLL